MKKPVHSYNELGWDVLTRQPLKICWAMSRQGDATDWDGVMSENTKKVVAAEAEAWRKRDILGRQVQL